MRLSWPASAQVTSEDSTDNDNNDTYLTLVAVSLSNTEIVVSSLESAAAPQASREEFSSQLELHAKSYYDDPDLRGAGDEHYMQVRFPTPSGALTYQGTGWSMSDSQYFDDVRPFGGYLYVYIKLDKCVHAGLRDRLLEMTGTISYWGTRPTGYRSVDWTWAVLGSGRYTVTKVTN